MEQTRPKVLTKDTIRRGFRVFEYGVQGPVYTRSEQILQELKQGQNGRKKFSKIRLMHNGDALGLKNHSSLTFLRQVLSLTMYPALLEQGTIFPKDAVDRAKKILEQCKGNTIGTSGLPFGLTETRESIAEALTRRDGGVECHADDIVLSNGTAFLIRTVISLMGCCLNGKKAGVMLPTPQYPLFSACLQEYEIAEIKYYLDESKDWGLDLDSLRKSVTEARKWCQPTAIVVINPGNPTGQVMSEKELKEIVKFAYEENLVIISDEVYQEAVYAPDRKFHSMKKVMTNMGKPYSQLELFSFISASKGITCECGLRGGLMEMVNVDQFVRNKLYTLMATQICPNTLGQIALDVILNPPAKGEPSHEQYKQEVADILDNMRRKSELARDTFNSLPGIHCNRIDSGYYSFPRVEMPEKAIEEAEARGLDPDTFYVLELLNETGICLSPGSSFGEAPGTVHFRLTFLVPDEELQQALALYKEFHLQFLQKYK